MDALVQLALMTKAKLIFESSDTFLSFPALSPLSYTPEQLNFSQAWSNPEKLLLFSEFSQLTNMLPQGVLFQPSEGRFWDVYGNLLQSAQLGTKPLSVQQQAALQQAQEFLWTTDQNGLRTASAAVLSYMQYHDAWIHETETYKNQEITADTSTDPNVKAQWNTLEPLFRAKVQAAEDDWNTKGFKPQVEQARQVEAALSPESTWPIWSSQFNPTVDLQTEPTTNQSFAITAFSPSNILDQTNWPTFSINGSEIPQLVKRAPQELTILFGTDQGNTTIDSVSFEFCSVVLARPWFRPEVLKVRFWRFSDPSLQLSDGMVPPHGQWPAYITAIVFARNIAVTTRSSTGAVQATPILAFPPIILRPNFTSIYPISPIMLHPTLAPTIRALPVLRSELPVMSVTSPAIQSHALARLNAATFKILPGTLSSSTTPTTPSPTGSQLPAAKEASVSILAFICKRLPRCPDPDPNLQW